MKKLITLLTITCMALAVNAQVYLGVKGGGGISVLTPGSLTHLPSTHFAGGLAYKHQIFNRVVLEGNILFDMRATEVENEPDFAPSASYVSVPLTIHWIMPFTKKKLVPYVTEDYNTYWYVEGGPQLGYALSSTTYIDKGFSTLHKDDWATNAFDVGVVAGIGVNFAFKNSRNRLAVGARGHYGLLNFNKYENAPAFNNITAAGYVSYDFKWTKKRHYRYRM
ncbi:MAG: PorT family protein [Bacteroidia bacterium]